MLIRIAKGVDLREQHAHVTVEGRIVSIVGDALAELGPGAQPCGDVLRADCAHRHPPGETS